MSEGYLVYHGLRLIRQAFGIARESRRADAYPPGQDPTSVAIGSELLRRSVAEATAARDALGEHPFEAATRDNDPDFENTWINLMKKPTGGYRLVCVVCKRPNDGIVHRPTWRRG